MVTSKVNLVSPELRALNNTFATISFSKDRIVTHSNNKFLQIFGFDQQEVVGKSDDFFLHADNNQKQLNEFWQNINTIKRFECDHLCQKNDGSEIWVNVHYSVLRDSSAQISDIIAIIRDISTQKLTIAEEHGQVKAINASQAVIQFSMDGNILEANDIFLKAIGYQRQEIIGKHHSMFITKEDVGSKEYKDFWNKLSEGGFHSGEFKRQRKDGSDLWLQATYSPISDPAGRLLKVVKYAADISDEKLKQAEFSWQLAAIHKSQSVVSFDMYGVILDANQEFLDATGYTLDEICGNHHRIFVQPSYAHSTEYASFWRDLRAGTYHAGQYCRVNKDGQNIWLQATYNPVFDPSGKPIKVVKYASVVTDTRLMQAEYEGQIAAIYKAQCVISFNLEGTIIDANDNFLKAMGYRYNEVRGAHHSMFVKPEDAKSVEYKAFWQTLAKGHYFSGEYKRIDKNGNEIWLQATYNPIFDLSGKPFKVVKYATDVTEEKMLMADFRGQIEAIKRSQSIVALSLDGIILDANDAFLELLGYGRDEVVGKHHKIFVDKQVYETQDYQKFWQTLQAGNFHSGLYKRISKTGDEVWLQATYNPILDPNGVPTRVMKIATDVSENIALAEAYKNANRQAQHDPSTSLPNRNRLASFLDEAMAEEDAQIVVLYIDLDLFKPVNDSYGHAMGDKVLGEIADRLRRLLHSDQLVARVGGDEFVMALPNFQENRIAPFCRQILDSVEAPIHHDDGDIKISASIGIAMSPNDGTKPDDLLRCADAALYVTKESGRGSFNFYAAELNEKMVADRRLVQEMRKGLLDEEFFLEYQPRFGTNNRKVRSMEALVRWSHPEHGRIAPNDFIPLAEKSGLIKPLGEWILRTACETAKNWHGVGVSVNISPIQFRAGNLSELVKSVLLETGLPAHLLELEITENVLIEDADAALEELNALKQLDVRLAMDDFGSGYSSFNYLRNFPFDVIKIDRQYISELETNPKDRAIVQAILKLGNALNLSVTAEGVETNAQLAILTNEQCREVQGFLLAKPLPSHELNGFFIEPEQSVSSATN